MLSGMNNIKSYATIIEMDITIADLKLNFIPHSGIYIAPINEKNCSANNSYFATVYGVKIKDDELLTYENIGGISVDSERGFIQVKDFETAYNQYKSFLIFTRDNIDYIAINFFEYEQPYKKEILTSQKNFFSTRDWLNEYGIETNIFNSQIVEDIIESIDNSDIEGDALTFETLETNEMSATLLNYDGRFDNFDNLYGNGFLVHQQYDYEKESKIVFSGFIETPEFSYLDTVTIRASDIRHSYSTTLPARSFNIDEYPQLEKFPENVSSGEDTIDTKRTIAAGKGIIVKCTPIKYFAGDINDPYNMPEIIFEIVDTTDHSIDAIVEKPDKYDNNKIKPHVYFIEKSQGESITHNGTVITGDIETFIPEYKNYNDGNGLQKVWELDKIKGTLTFRGSKQVKTISAGMTSNSNNMSDELVEVYIEIDIPPYTALQFISDALCNYENISYIKENYNIENYEKEKLRSREIAILLTNDESKSILDLVGSIQFLEQGRLEIENNLITFNSTKDRIVKIKLHQHKMGRIDKTVDTIGAPTVSGEYLSSCSIGYNLDKNRYENKSYESEAKKKHRLTNSEDFDTLLKNKSDAIELSNEIMKNRYTLAYYYTFEYYETQEGLKLFDLVEIEYKREDGSYYIKPCVCEIVKLNIFDNIVKLRHLYTIRI